MLKDEIRERLAELMESAGKGQNVMVVILNVEHLHVAEAVMDDQGERCDID